MLTLAILRPSWDFLAVLGVLGQDPRQVAALSKGPRVPPGLRCVPHAQSLQ